MNRSLIRRLICRLSRVLGLVSLCTAASAFSAPSDEELRAKAQEREAWNERMRQQSVVTRAEKERELKRLDVVYEHMLRYGINREDVKSIGRGASISGPYQNSSSDSEYGKILADRVLKPGEHYRFEVDQYIVTIPVPDAVHGSSWIVPYADTRSDPERDAILRKSTGGLQLANLSWYYGTGIWPLFVGWQGGMSMELRYRAVSAENKNLEIYATPESLRSWTQKIIETYVPTPADVEDAARRRRILTAAGTQIYLDAEPVVINGRVWVRYALNKHYGRSYAYKTKLGHDRWLHVHFSLPEYDYNANPDRTTYPAALQRAFADMEAMLASLRVAILNDDGAPDPFVVERVEAAPLPLREKLPTAP